VIMALGGGCGYARKLPTPKQVTEEARKSGHENRPLSPVWIEKREFGVTAIGAPFSALCSQHYVIYTGRYHARRMHGCVQANGTPQHGADPFSYENWFGPYHLMTLL